MMLRFWPVMNSEGEGAGAGGPPAGDKAAQKPAETPANDPAKPPGAAKKPTVLRLSPRANGNGNDRTSLKTISTELDEVRKASADTKAALDTTAKELLDERFEAVFEAAGIDDKYRDYARNKLGSINPKSAEGRKAVDDFAKAHPGMLKPATVGGKAPESTWLNKTLDSDKAGKSLAARMGRDMLEASLDKMVQ